MTRNTLARKLERILSPLEVRAYLSHRERGDTPALALYRVKLERTCAAVLTLEAPDYDAPRVIESWEVDADALERATAGALENVTEADGSPVYRQIILPPGASCLVWCEHDDASTPLEAECYSADDVAAWRDNRWEYVGTRVRVELADGAEGTADVWGTEAGDYWPGSTAAQLWHNIPDLIAEALAEALASVVSCPTCGRPTLEGGKP